MRHPLIGSVVGRLGRVKRLVCLSAVLLLAASPALAIDPNLPLKSLQHTVWTAKDGLPSDSLLTLEQTRDGFLWIATSGGLVRFDGEHFERIELPRDTKLKSTSACALRASREGGIWIGFRFGGVALLKDGRLKVYDSDDGLPEGTIRWITEAPDGVIWIAASSGVAKLDASGRWQPVEIGRDAPAIRSVTFDAEGAMWALGWGPDVYRQTAKESKFTLFHHDLEVQIGMNDVVPASDGSVWVLGSEKALRVAPSGAALRPIRNDASVAYLDSAGSLWMSKGQEFLKFNTAGAADIVDLSSIRDRLATQESFRSSSGLLQFLETDDGQMWCLTASSLQRFSKRAVSTLDTNFIPLEYAGEMGIGAPSAGGLWVMPQMGPLRIVERNRVRIVPGLTDIAAISRMSDGSTWAGGAGRFWHLNSQGWHPVPPPPDIDTSDVQAIAGRGGEDAWVSVVRKGVYHWQAGRWERNGGIAELPSEPAVTLAWAPDGSLWLGYVDGRIARLQGGSARILAAQDGADIGVVTALVASGTQVWAGGEFGLRRWNGRRFVAVHTDRPRAFDQITGIVAASSGDLWLNSAVGIVRILGATLATLDRDGAGPVDVDVFDRLDGYRGSGARVRPLPTALEDRDGRVWFVSTSGVFSVNPTASEMSRPPPRPMIKALVANGSRHEPTGSTVLGKGTRALQIDFVAIDLVVPERVRYRYRLDGVDAQWRDGGVQQQAFYTNVNAGQHQFHVIASSDGRIWSPEATLDFRIDPTFTQTVWFTALCVLAAIAVAVLLLRWRVRQVARRLRWRLETQVAERDRIARELHDTLLQSTQGLILSFQAISNRMPVGDANRDKMETALERADEVLTEGRDRVRVLRRTSPGNSGLSAALRSFGEELAADSNIAFRCECAGSEPPLLPDVSDEVQRIVSEALLNAFRHSRANSVVLYVTGATNTLTLQVEDDGTGIDAQMASPGARPGHWGLRGMRERSERIGARLNIGPGAGTGTRVELILDIRRSGTRK